MPTSAEVAYLDTSAAVKLILREPESQALRGWLRHRSRRASSALLRVELLRVVRRAGLPGLLAAARQLLAGTQLIRVDDALLDMAADLDPITVRSLDAIHLVAARRLEPLLVAVVTYDVRMIEAASALGLTTVSPA